MELKQYQDEVDLQKYWLVLKRRLLPAAGIFSLAVALSAVAAMRQKPVYEAEGKLLLKTDRQSALVGLVENPEDYTLDGQSSALTTQAEVIRSVPVAERVIDELNLKDEAGERLTAPAFLGNLTVKPVGGTDVLRISYQADDPETAANVVNKLAQAYIQQTISDSRKEAAQARQFIVEQLPKTEASVRAAESALRDFKERNGVIALEQEATAAVDVISRLQDQLSTTQAELADAGARVALLQSQLGMGPEEAIAMSTLSQAPGVQQALVELQTTQNLLSVERTRYQPQHPAIANLERKVDALNATLAERITQVLGSTQGVSMGDLQLGDVERGLIADLVRADAQRSGLANRLSTLVQTQTSYQARAGALPRLEQTQRELERQLAAAQATYETLLTRLQEIQVAENQNVGNARLISPALVPTGSAGTGKSTFLALGGLAGLLLGTAAAFALDLADRSIKTVKEARELFGYTLLGMIPSFSRCGKTRTYYGGDVERPVPRIVARDCPQSPVGEAYQMLQANLKFLSSDKEVKTIVVTSSAPREGKSEVSANLATAIAQIGARVLLVDADMRHPAQHHAWELNNATGLSNVLVEQVDFKSAVQQVMPNMDVLTAGVIPPNPIALLDSKRMASLIQAFSNEYDYVVFDTPPLAGTADAAVLGKMADGLLLVVRPGVVDSASATASKEFLAQTGQNVFGIVVNGVDMRNEPDSYFYYSREYHGTKQLPSQLPVPGLRSLAGSKTNVE